ncbi:MAG TPA: helix-turn-helix domain-containing protein [Candidatus Nanoarchaeia archaeon]|nr:helix-turn-helix domain-containing protein [Candidatus Nanoarchaeia archaeon]
MVNKLLLPQEIETFYLIPTMRRYIALFLKEQGMKQKDIAELLGIKTATISQYTSNKRGHRIEFNEKAVAEIRKSVSLLKDKLSYLRETQRLLQHFRETKVLCQIHHQFSDLPEHCEPQEIGCLTGGYK